MQKKTTSAAPSRRELLRDIEVSMMQHALSMGDLRLPVCVRLEHWRIVNRLTATLQRAQRLGRRDIRLPHPR